MPSSATLMKVAKRVDRLVGAVGLKLELGRGVAEHGGPGVELVHAALAQRIRILKPQHGEHLAERIGDRRARSLDEGAARLLAFEKPRLDVEIPGALRAVRIDPLQIGLIGREGEFAKFMRLIDDDLVDADLLERHHVVAAASQRLELFRRVSP